MTKKEAKKLAKRLLWYSVDRIKQSEELSNLTQGDNDKVCEALDEITYKWI